MQAFAMPAPHFPDMTPQVPRAQHDDASRFSADVYRASNLDLRGMSDAQLRAHFAASRHEPRLFGPTPDTVNFMSMRWLRGRGVEVGAGGSPTPLYGPTTTLQADCDPGLAFGGRTLDMPGSIDDPRFAQQAEGRFDFSIASHVLEHADSFIRSVDNLVTLVRPGGVAYIVLPDIAFLDGLSFGASGAFGRYDNAGDHDLSLFGFDLFVKKGPFEVLGEAVFGDLDRDAALVAAGAPGGLSGWYVEGRFHFFPDAWRGDGAWFGEESTFTLVFRAESVDTDDSATAIDFATRGRGMRDDVERYTIGFNFRPVEKTVVKIEYQFLREPGGFERDNDRLVLSCAVSF